VELGYGLHTPYWGRGLATEVARELLRLGRHELRRPSIVAITRPVNLGSQRVLVKTGLVYERDVAFEGCRISCIGRSRKYDVWREGDYPTGALLSIC